MAASLILQSDWDEALMQAGGKAWVILKRLEGTSIHGELRTVRISSERLPEIVPSEGFVVTDVTKRSITVSFPSENISSQFIAPTATFYNIHKGSVVSLDVSTGGSLAVSSDVTGQLFIWQTSDGAVRRELKGHHNTVETCRFFPSGIVALSGGSDTLLKIWSAEDGSCPVTLKGHVRGITDTAIVDRGRNVVSCSRDGMAKLWDVGQAQCLDTVARCGCTINSCALDATDNRLDLKMPQSTPSEREVGTEGKLLLLAREDGILQGIGLHSRKQVFQVGGASAVNSCAFLSPTQVAAGTQEGKILIVDLRNPSEPLEVIQRSHSSVLSLTGFKKGLLATTGAGSSFYRNSEDRAITELTGPDCDPVYCLASNRNSIYTSCRDKHVRKYQLFE